jgi:short-subunit dehydrogenase involved in D-alanine esterification of teichoic acids
LIAEHPNLNVLFNNAGIMNIDDASVAIDEKLLVSTLTTNLMGPIRMTGALIEHLKRQPQATVINTTSVVGFIHALREIRNPVDGRPGRGHKSQGGACGAGKLGHLGYP